MHAIFARKDHNDFEAAEIAVKLNFSSIYLINITDKEMMKKMD